MIVFRFFCVLLSIHTAVLAESLRNGKLNSFSRTRRFTTANNSNTCTTQKLLLHSPIGAILKTSDQRNKHSFQLGARAAFSCKDGYRQVGELQSFTCQQDGTWREYSTDRTGLCVIKQCKVDTFSCKDNRTKIDACEQCDCIAQCPDQSDEVSCAPTVVNVTGKAIGLLRSSAQNRNPDKTNTTCSSWKILTNDRGFYIKLLFKRFSMSPNCTQSYISLENARIVDPSTAQCCESSDSAVCRFGGTTSPPLSRTVTNWMTVVFFSTTSDSYFAAIWYNVNRLYPNGSIPIEDGTYPVKIKLPKVENYTPPSDPTSSTLAVIFFALLLFAFGCFIGYKLAKRFLGPACSVRYFLACIRCRPIPPPSPTWSLFEDQEHRSILTTDNASFIGEEFVRETPSRLEATYMGDYSDDSRNGSTEDMI